jgi:integrase
MASKALGCLKSAIRDAQRRGQVAQNVASGVTVKTGGRHKRKIEVGRDVPTPEEVRAILDAASPRWRPVIVTAVFTGLRSSELRGLTWAHVDFERKLIRVRQRADRWGDMGAPKSEAGSRDLPMVPPVLNGLREWRLACPRGELGLVFPGDDGAALEHSTLYRRCFGDAQKAAGVVDSEGRPKYGPHGFRHFAGSWWIDRGFQPKRIQVLMGHSSIVMTMDVYGHLFPAAEDEHEKLATAALQLVSGVG